MRTLSASCLAVATALFFVATPAQARFGRSDDHGNGNGGGGGNHGNGGGNSGGGGGGGNPHPATPINSDDRHSHQNGQGHVQHGNGNGYGHGHGATPATNDDGGNNNGGNNGCNDGCGNYNQGEVVVHHEYVAEPQPAYSGYYVGYQPVVGYDPSYDNADRVRLFLRGEASGASESITLAGSFRVDGRQWGFVVDERALFFSAYPTADVINVAHAHATYAFFTGPNGRARTELGVAGAFADQLTAFAPSLGVSVDLALIWGLGIEASAHAVPFPYRSVEYSVGTSFALGPASVHMGWRSIYLDDAGLVDGVTHSDTSAGLYLGVGYTF
jgi:hypothetical protein